MIEWHKGIELDGVGQVYGKTTALADVNFSIQPGAIYGILGPNGSGKTTVLRLIGLLEKPSQGHILVAGMDPWLMEPRRRLDLAREITLLAQKPILLSTTVEENIGYGLRLRAIPQDQIKERVLEAATLLEVDHLLRRFAPRLSGGEAQRVAAARALVIKPRLLLMDEPTASLDPAQVRVLETAIRTVSHQGQTTILLVTHNIGQAHRLAQEVLFLYQGQVVERAKSRQFFAQPQQTETQEFLRNEGFGRG